MTYAGMVDSWISKSIVKAEKNLSLQQGENKTGPGRHHILLIYGYGLIGIPSLIS